MTTPESTEIENSKNAAPCCCPPAETVEQSDKTPADAPCCPPQETASCCAPQDSDKPGYTLSPFVTGWIDTPTGQTPQIATRLTRTDLYGRWAMRWGIGRDRYRITPGLYAIGTPDDKAPVLVSANYKLSFDCLRSSLQHTDAWILVIDTKGVNVWCAAGKGTFGTTEIVKRCQLTRLDNIVSHRTLIVPQLGAPGVAAHTVKKETGFHVVYGPVRAKDLPLFLANDMQATDEMRRVTFTPIERFILTPVELSMMGKTLLYAMILLFVLSGIGPDIFTFKAAWTRGLNAALPLIAGLISGSVLTPVLLPWLPGRMFAIKGALTGGATALLLAATLYSDAGLSLTLALTLTVGAISSYTAMNFTGSSTFTSPSGVEKEMRLTIPWQAGSLLLAIGLWISSAF